MKITEARLRQIVREELQHLSERASKASPSDYFSGEEERGAYDDGYERAMRGMPQPVSDRDWAKTGYLKDSREAYAYMAGFSQGEHEFGYRMEGEEAEAGLDEAMTPEKAAARTVPFRHHSVRSDQVPRGRDAMWEEEDFIRMFPAGIDGMEISDPGMANWSPSVPQIVYLGSCPKYHYYKLSTSPDYFKVDK